MLFVTKSGTCKRVTEAVRPMIRMVEIGGGIPIGFWEDPVILGFLSGSIRGLIECVSNGKNNGNATGEIIVGVFTRILGEQDGMAVSRQNVSLMQNEAYEKAVMAGFLSAMVARHGPERVMDQEIVIEAVAHSKRLKALTQSIVGTISNEALLSFAIQDLIYNRRVKALRV